MPHVYYPPNGSELTLIKRWAIKEMHGDGLTYEQMAEELGLNVYAVNSAIYQMRKRGEFPHAKRPVGRWGKVKA